MKSFLTRDTLEIMKKHLLATLILISTGFNLFAHKKNELLVTITKTEVKCFGNANGSAELNISGGHPPYKIRWSSGEESTKINSLIAGEYTYEVTDEKGSKVVGRVVLEQPKPLTVSFYSKKYSDIDNLNASMNIAIEGGSSWVHDSLVNNFYIFKIDDKFNYEHPELIKNGIHKISIQDSRGCALEFKANLNVNLVDSHETKDFIHSLNGPKINVIVRRDHLAKLEY